MHGPTHGHDATVARTPEELMDAFDRLVDVVARLRGPDGCDWDRAQTPTAMRRFVLEEAHEVVDAIDRGAADDLRDELGDLLFNIVLLARMHQERGDFSVSDAVDAAADKMVRRHPHVFAGADGPPDWEAVKAAERDSAGHTSALDGVPRALPALVRAERIGARAAGVGFDWPDIGGVRAKLDEELAELDAALAAGDPDAVEDELGDVLFTLVNLSRFTRSPAEDALRRAVDKFEARFRRVESLSLAEGRTVLTCGLDMLERLWAHAKESP